MAVEFTTNNGDSAELINVVVEGGDAYIVYINNSNNNLEVTKGYMGQDGEVIIGTNAMVI